METPAPIPTDPEDVTIALETAAALAAKGDVSEAVRWLGRAADFASLSGNGSRAEVLARSARSLSDASNAKDDLESPPLLPAPPPRRASVRPRAPSERPSDASNSQPMLLVRPASSTPAPASVRASTSSPLSARASTPAPPSVGPQKPAASPARPSAVPAGATALASSPSHAPAPSAANGAKESQEVSAVRESSPRASVAPKPIETPKATPKPSDTPKASTKPSLHHELHRPFRLQGARVSIAPSQGSSRYYVLKVLEDGEPVPQGEHEAFLVLADPNSAR